MQPLPQNENIPQLAELLSGFPCVDALFLFGSHAEGRSRRFSDIDIGIAADIDQLDACLPEMYGAAAKEGFDKLSHVPLVTATPLLGHEIVKHNQILFARQGFDAADLVSRVNRQFFDMRPYLLVQAAAYKKRVLNGKT
jgi:hypothetical protein